MESQQSSGKWSVSIEGKDLTIETGKVARQADGAVMVRYGDTVVLVTAVAKPTAVVRDFFPLIVDYREKSYAAGKIPGGFFKREGRPQDKETISARMIDRPIRPLFPKGYREEVQIMVMVLSTDREHASDILGIVGASAALSLSDIPFLGPIGAVRVAKVGDQLILNPTFAQRAEASMEAVVAGDGESIVMVEGGAREVGEDEFIDALDFARKGIRQIVDLQKEMMAQAGKPDREFAVVEVKPDIIEMVRSACLDDIRRANETEEKSGRSAVLSESLEKILEQVAEKFPEENQAGMVKSTFHDLEREEVRNLILETKRRIDGRSMTEVRSISCEVGVLPRTHGSAIFTRGQTQALAVTTLGTTMDEQRVDDLEEEGWKSYMLHYNFPPFSVGEVRPIRGPGRREIGHGMLAERALRPVIPSGEVFPYTVRLVSDILESNGSSSMATVCSGSLSLMDAGVPVSAAVAGIAMGVVKEDGKAAILTDILGTEDHLGDMDLKIAGTSKGVTAFQLDSKIKGLEIDLLRQAVSQAREAINFILGEMARSLSEARGDLSAYAPRIVSIAIPKEKIGEVIGPGGRTIRKITEETGAKIDINDEGVVKITSMGEGDGEKALQMVRLITEDPEVGRIYKGTVKRVVDFGAFVEILPNKDGLVHISELETRRVAKVEDVVREGDEVEVKVINIDRDGKIKLSRKAVLNERRGSGGEHSGGGRGGGKDSSRH
ncbi:MAG: polyribonucleotide nucleotidyltransferase [Candidatus Eisenbacteria sp.]|nr:polyribonucleotide nucleotidyltransferase [Candidatus Eisenbacteria bacterium]